MEAVRRHGQLAAPLQLAHVLAELLCVIPRALGAAVRLVEDYHGVRRNVVRAARHRVDGGQIPVRVRHGEAAAEPVGVGAQGRGERGGILAAAAARIFRGEAVDLAGHSLGANVSMHYAGVRPARIRRLVALDGFGIPAEKPEQVTAKS